MLGRSVAWRDTACTTPSEHNESLNYLDSIVTDVEAICEQISALRRQVSQQL